MHLTRRGFLAALAAVPVVGRLVPERAWLQQEMSNAVQTFVGLPVIDADDFTWQPATLNLSTVHVYVYDKTNQAYRFIEVDRHDPKIPARFSLTAPEA